jgi:hemerythrin-like domain-containing protein
MNSDLFPAPAPNFADPLGLLRACHGRIRHHCETLAKLSAHIQANGVDSEARKAAAQVLLYFNTAGRHHHGDEDEDLFPLLARQSLKLADKVHRARQDHAALDGLWQQLAPLLERPATITDPALFAAAADAFCARQLQHLGYEEEELLEVAQHILGRDDLKRLGNAMAKRRGRPIAID